MEKYFCIGAFIVGAGSIWASHDGGVIPLSSIIYSVASCLIFGLIAYRVEAQSVPWDCEPYRLVSFCEGAGIASFLAYEYTSSLLTKGVAKFWFMSIQSQDVSLHDIFRGIPYTSEILSTLMGVLFGLLSGLIMYYFTILVGILVLALGNYTWGPFTHKFHI